LPWGSALASPAFGAAEDPAAAAAAKAAPQVKPPVIAEPFTVLACDQNSTIGMEGCEEHKPVAADKRIDREVRLLFTILPDSAERRRLGPAETAWFAYRQADSPSRADLYEGGSESPVASLACAVNHETRGADLHAFFVGLEQGRVTFRRSRRSGDFLGALPKRDDHEARKQMNGLPRRSMKQRRLAWNRYPKERRRRQTPPLPHAWQLRRPRQSGNAPATVGERDSQRLEVAEPGRAILT